MRRFLEERPEISAYAQMVSGITILFILLVIAFMSTTLSLWSPMTVISIPAGIFFSCIIIRFGIKDLRSSSSVGHRIRVLNSETDKIKTEARQLMAELEEKHQNRTPMLTDLMATVSIADTGIVDDKEESSVQ